MSLDFIETLVSNNAIRPLKFIRKPENVQENAVLYNFHCKYQEFSLIYIVLLPYYSKLVWLVK